MDTVAVLERWDRKMKSLIVVPLQYLYEGPYGHCDIIAGYTRKMEP